MGEPGAVQPDAALERRLDLVAIVVTGAVFLVVAVLISFGEAIADEPEKGSIELLGRELLRFEDPHSAVQAILAWAAAGLAVAGTAAMLLRPSRRRAILVVYVLVLTLAATAFFFGSTKTAFTRRAYFDAADDLHYVMGTKYFDEVGYRGLYECMAVARAESGHRNPKYIRSLETNKVLRLRGVVNRDTAARCHAKFSDARWIAFRRDVEEFEKWPRSRKWSRTFRDHGYNGTPVRTALQKPLVNSFELSQKSLCRAGIADVLMIAVACCLGIWAFGWRLGVLLLGLYWVNYLDFAFMGGAFLRYVGASCVLMALSFLKLDRPVLAGLVLALGTGFVIFPSLFFLGAFVVGAVALVRTGKIPSSVIRFVAAGMVGGGVLFLLSLINGGGLAAWAEFLHQMELNSGRMSPGRIGFVYDFIYPKEFLADAPRLPSYEDRIDALRAGRFGWMYAPGVRLTLAAALLAALAWQHRSLDLPALTAALGFAALFLLLSTVRYYYAGMLGLPVVFHAHHRTRGGALFIASLFALCSVGHCIWQETAEAFRYNSLASGFLTVFLLAIAVYFGVHRRRRARKSSKTMGVDRESP